MPYKDELKQREANRLANKVYRDKQKGITPGGITGQGITLDEGQRLHPGAAPGARILSDGQLWYPDNLGYHPKECHCDAHPDRDIYTFEVLRAVDRLQTL